MENSTIRGLRRRIELTKEEINYLQRHLKADEEWLEDELERAKKDSEE